MKKKISIVEKKERKRPKFSEVMRLFGIHKAKKLIKWNRNFFKNILMKV